MYVLKKYVKIGWMMSHHCFLLHISLMKADRNINSSVPGPLDMSWPWAMSISKTFGQSPQQTSGGLESYQLECQYHLIGWSCYSWLHIPLHIGGLRGLKYLFDYCTTTFDATSLPHIEKSEFNLTYRVSHMFGKCKNGYCSQIRGLHPLEGNLSIFIQESMAALNFCHSPCLSCSK